MKMFAAAAIMAIAALGTPAALGQAQAVNVSAASSRSLDLDGFARQGRSTALFPAPDPSVAWIMALGFLGLVVVRRTRSPPIR